MDNIIPDPIKRHPMYSSFHFLSDKYGFFPLLPDPPMYDLNTHKHESCTTLNIFFLNFNCFFSSFEYAEIKIQWKLLNVIMVNVISHLLSSDLVGPVYVYEETKVTANCYHSVNVVSVAWSQSDHIKQSNKIIPIIISL
jgi:hypothetical protein